MSSFSPLRLCAFAREYFSQRRKGAKELSGKSLFPLCLCVKQKIFGMIEYLMDKKKIYIRV